MSDFVLFVLPCSMALIDNMMPAEGVCVILGRWKTAASNCVEALHSPPHRCKCRRWSEEAAVLKRKATHCFMSSFLHLSNKTIDLSPLFSSSFLSLHLPTLPDSSILSSSTVMLYVIDSLPSEEKRSFPVRWTSLSLDSSAATGLPKNVMVQAVTRAIEQQRNVPTFVIAKSTTHQKNVLRALA
jgi:hypothetical protein